jgi:hypothetical protein
MDRLDKLKNLEARLLAAMSEEDGKSLAPLARQYRETIREIEEIEGAEENGDEIAEILSEREVDGKPGAVR